jgi:hypothetical protein
VKWVDQALDRLGSMADWGYHPGGPSSSEPTAIAGLALASHGRTRDSDRALGWLARVQGDGRGVGVGPDHPEPKWPTAWAALSWSSAVPPGTATPAGNPYAGNIDRAVGWLLEAKGKAITRSPELGHDTSLVGWAWIESTHSWVEPTALGLLALRATGRGGHTRSREAAGLLIDRLLPSGGCNYGNTAVFGRMQRPQVSTTALALLALVGEPDPSGLVAGSLAYLSGELSDRTATAPLCFGLMALAAHGRQHPEAADWLAAARDRSLRRGAGAIPLALLCLAALGERSPLVDMARRRTDP